LHGSYQQFFGFFSLECQQRTSPLLEEAAEEEEAEEVQEVILLVVNLAEAVMLTEVEVRRGAANKKFALSLHLLDYLCRWSRTRWWKRSRWRSWTRWTESPTQEIGHVE
jgi:hypothetical protein